MTRHRKGLHDQLRSKTHLTVSKYPARKFPVQHEIQKLEAELAAFNERIEELENAGHRSRAMDVLKENAMDFARRIDELRGVLIEAAPRSPTRSK